MRKILIFSFWIAVWWLLSLAVNNKILLAGPVETVMALMTMLGKGSFYLTVASSLLRIGVGFLLGFFLGVLLAAAGKRYRWLEELLAPFMNLIKTIPVASFVVLLLIWWGSSFLAVAISFLVVLPNIYISTLEGFKNVDTKLLEMAHVFKMSLWNRFFYIYRPALKPFLYSGLKISLGMCWKSGVAAEVIGTPDYSIGERLYLSKVYLDTAELFGWTAVIIVLCVLFEKLVLWMVEKFFAWEPACRVRSIKRRGQLSKVSNKESEMNVDEESKAGNEIGSGREKFVAEKIKIVLENITKSYNGQTVLDNLCATYLPGETYYLTSPSGSGKTTLLQILAGLTEADSGVVQVPDSCSMVFQEDRLCEDYNAVKNVEMVVGYTKHKNEYCGDEVNGGQIVGKVVTQMAEAALSKLLPEESLQKPCRELSGGMKRRVALVRAMEADSEVVLLDEPFTGMDVETRKRAEEYIRERQGGRTVIIATHI